MSILTAYANTSLSPLIPVFSSLVGQALHVLTVEFGNATLGSQASKHAEAFRRGQKMAAITDVASIVLEEVS